MPSIPGQWHTGRRIVIMHFRYQAIQKRIWDIDWYLNERLFKKIMNVCDGSHLNFSKPRSEENSTTSLSKKVVTDL